MKGSTQRGGGSAVADDHFAEAAARLNRPRRAGAGRVLRLITTLISCATATDVTLAELHLEAFLPADQPPPNSCGSAPSAAEFGGVVTGDGYVLYTPIASDHGLQR